VAALTIVKEKAYPTLNSILFGEGVVNDAVSILLFRAVERLMKVEIEENGGFTNKSELNISMNEIGLMFISFVVLTFCSIVIGLSFGLLCAFVFKHLSDLENHPVREIFLLLLFAYVNNQ
jgi:NhaP-type Na+/H+ or K+/H+ antiporter